ncbi:AlpA family phage regulatory protein [Xylella taiwanensis]|nr:AlpA family phage regulatory protein [Xylella taiwanensis]MCD8466249.1 AlpA family phage regulatory protein [Xylella taiwanensis]MCD8469232.1 AlpA family phage regulatory protein [Xylella taiwanensis]MCD8472451.1 AlpA family phage regulatory protein [Xylella taiwanensis]NBI36016.1 AlpA family phage regulatory protein [Xylella taiwanensis]QKD98993.1 AlpA family phage regulatory protein [Xylella taiwanensis]
MKKEVMAAETLEYIIRLPKVIETATFSEPSSHRMMKGERFPQLHRVRG